MIVVRMALAGIRLVTGGLAIALMGATLAFALAANTASALHERCR